jgi:uncharacterized protein YjbI with pentapeptide repeats
MVTIRPKHYSKQITLVLAALICLCAAEPAPGLQPSPSPTDQSSSVNQQILQEEKLRQEIIKLQLENRKLGGWGELLLPYGTLLTVAVAFGGLIVTFWKQINENGRQKEQDRQQRQRDLEQQERNRHEQELGRLQREEENRRRLEEKFTAIVGRLGSHSPSIQASAAVSIMTFLKPENEEFHAQAFFILLANLKVQHNEAIQGNEVLNRLLIAAFERAIRTQAPIENVKGRESEIDLSRCCLNRADLSNLDLSSTDFAFSELRGVNLTSSILFRARGIEANMERSRLSRANLSETRFRRAYFSGAQFHGSNLVAADLKEADLKNAQFQQAMMQSAHLEKADLTDARFEQANLSDAFFKGVTLSPSTLRSILKAKNWREAHWDEPVLEQLNELADGMKKGK